MLGTIIYIAYICSQSEYHSVTDVDINVKTDSNTHLKGM